MEICHRQKAQMNREDALISGQWIRYKEPWYFKRSSVEMIEKSCCIVWQTVSTPPTCNNQLSFRKEAGCAVGPALWLIKCHTTVTFFKFTLIEDCCLLLIVSCRKFHHSSFGKYLWHSPFYVISFHFLFQYQMRLLMIVFTFGTTSQT